MLATISFIINIPWVYNYPIKNIPYRIARVPDSLLRLIYIYLNVGAFFLAIFFLSRGNRALNFWIKGAVIAAFYGWYLAISSAFNIPYLSLPGMDESPQKIVGIVRCGTFKEGNYFGLYLLLSATIAFYLNKIKIAWFLMVSILVSFSTISIFSAILLLGVYFKSYFLKKKVLRIILIIIPLLMILLVYFIKGDFYKKYVHDKLFTPLNSLTTSNLSKVDRYLTGNIAYEAGIDNPFFGVGPYNYGLHYDEYNTILNIVDNHSKWSINFFNRDNIRAIPNNVYLEIWAEYGIIGFVLFLSFLIITLRTALKLKNIIITGGLLAMYISLNAFPSFIMLFLWVYLAIPYGLAIRQNRDKEKLL
ncbi:O-antigen ligase family protein [Maribacter vaceletii]|uniref:O-antigen ligase family protein n=1 Tax=Maribacter vaceletii TaxID=1206816 RepID=UPI0011C43669|nr:O-antigen ligase family protein [Maribacter vaceletii]